MPGLPLRWRAEAKSDYHSIVIWYAETAEPNVPDRFIDALIKTETAIVDYPALGSRSFATPGRKPVLRFRKVAGFPYLVFYVEHEDRIEIWRILHSSRDIPQHL